MTGRRLPLTAVIASLAAGLLWAVPPAQAASSWSWTTALVDDLASKHRHSVPREFVTVGDVVYFTAATRQHGRELWRTDGTASGTRLVKGVWSGPHSSQPYDLTAVGRTLYFSAVTSVKGDRELWKSDGTTAGTVRVSRAAPQTVYGQSRLTAVGSTLYFSGDAPGALEHGPELWASRGTATTTQRVKDIVPGDRGSWPTELTALGSSVLFAG